MKRNVVGWLFSLVGLIGLAMAPATHAADPPAEKPGQVPVRVGTYDSRCVMVAFCGSERFEAGFRRLDEALAKAKKDGEPEKIKKADRAIWEARMLTHRQGFGTWPVDNILRQTPEAVEQVKKKTGVTVLVSKWDKKALAKYADCEKIDVSTQLIDALNPNERQRRHAMGMLKVKPLGPQELEEVLKKEAGKHYLPPPEDKE